MNYLIYIAILAFMFWPVSEIIEIKEGGHNSTVYYMTSVFHILAGFGIWGLHLLQSPLVINLSLIGTVFISITYFVLAYFPIQVMNSKLSFSEFITIHPIYRVPGIINVIGFIIFGIAIIRIGFFPAWTGVIIILGTIIFAIAMTMKNHIVVNINNIIISATIIYMCIFGLR